MKCNWCNKKIDRLYKGTKYCGEKCRQRAQLKARQYYWKHREQVIAAIRKYQEEHKEKIREYQQRYAKEYYKKNKKRLQEYVNGLRLFSKYNRRAMLRKYRCILMRITNEIKRCRTHHYPTDEKTIKMLLKLKERVTEAFQKEKMRATVG